MTQLQGRLPYCLPLLEVELLPSFPNRDQAWGWVSPTLCHSPEVSPSFLGLALRRGKKVNPQI